MGNKLIVANWKMNGNIKKVQSDLYLYANNDITNQTNIVLALPYIYLIGAKQDLLSKSNIKVAAQDVSLYEKDGAYTGEISAAMLKDLAVDYVVIGHSERRHLIGECSDVIKQKVKNTCNNLITPIFCVGEQLDVRESGEYLKFIESQLKELENINLSSIVVAYEPCWSIGTGKIPTLKEIEEVVGYIHQYMQNLFKYGKIAVLYGGSVTGGNASDILAISGVDGVLVGGASLKTDDFIKICASA
ncbi:MAG: triose-phosphate isomerase [Burkholderiales bacterium]|nr:triose-phosphate isomerase [Burkholderiales bacterium]